MHIHKWEKINDFMICSKCGLTLTEGGKAQFDRRYINEPYMKKNRKNIRRNANKT